MKRRWTNLSKHGRICKGFKNDTCFCKDRGESLLNKNEFKICRTNVGNFMWLMENVKPDLAIAVPDLLKKTTVATLKDMNSINVIVKHIKE